MIPMYKRYKDSVPAGTVALCNTFGIAVFTPDETDRCKDNCDLVAAWWSAGNDFYGFHRHRIHYTKGFRPYIRKGSLRIYLDGMMRTA